MSEPTVYALYDGDEVIAVGTAKALAELMGCKTQRIYWYASGQARRRRAVPVTDLEAMDMFTRLHASTMNEVCSRIVRATRGMCRHSRTGCDWLGWCEPCYRAACKLVTERKRGKGDE